MTLASLPRPPFPAVRRSSTSSSSSLSSFTHCSSLLPELAAATWFFFGLVTVFESGDPVLRFRVCIVLLGSYKSAIGLEIIGHEEEKNRRARKPRRYRNFIAMLCSPFLLPPMQEIFEKSRGELERTRTLIYSASSLQFER